MEKQEAAVSCFKKGFNCSQTVLSVFAPDFGCGCGDRVPGSLRVRGRHGRVRGDVRGSDGRPHGPGTEIRYDGLPEPAGQGGDLRIREEFSPGICLAPQIYQVQGPARA